MLKYNIHDLIGNIHVSKNSINNLNSVKQVKHVVSFKPSGLYYALGLDWITFIQDWKENIYVKLTKKYLDTSYKYIYKVKIIDKSKLLILDSYNKVAKFTDKYSYKDKTKSFGMFIIDWYKVSKDYSGIEFKNYFKIKDHIILKKGKDIRDKCSWAATFDANGGCIWNTDIIKLERVKAI